MFNRSTVVTALGWCRAWFGALVMGLNHTIKQARTRAVFVQAAAIAALLLFAQAAPAQQSTIEIYEFVFVKLSGRPGHQGYFPMQSAPAPGQPSTIRVTLFGPVLSARAELVSTTGNLLAVVPLSRPLRSVIDTPDFYGNVVTPTEPFSVVVKGQELSGIPFTVGQKLETVFSPPTLQIEVVPLSSLLAPGTPARFHVQLVNYGAADTFSISATDTPSTSLALSATSISLGSQQSATVEISTLVPANSDSLPSYALTVSATGVANQATNSVNLTVDLASRAGQSLLVIIKPGSCEPEINARSHGVTPVAIIATADFDPTSIDPTSIYIAGNVFPSRIEILDVGFRKNYSRKEQLRKKYDCENIIVDGRNDLQLFFDTQQLVAAIKRISPMTPKMRNAKVSIPLFARTKSGTECRGFGFVRLDD